MRPFEGCAGPGAMVGSDEEERELKGLARCSCILGRLVGWIFVLQGVIIYIDGPNPHEDRVWIPEIFLRAFFGPLYLGLEAQAHNGYLAANWMRHAGARVGAVLVGCSINRISVDGRIWHWYVWLGLTTAILAGLAGVVDLVFLAWQVRRCLPKLKTQQ